LPDDAPQKEPEKSGLGRPFWSGTITFGLVSIPVNLFAATRRSRVALRMLGPRQAPLKRRYYSESERQTSDFIRGFEVEKGRYIKITDDELERLAPEKSRDIDLQRFVPADSIPPVYFERPYFFTPAGPSQKAYSLLAGTMEKTGRAGLATFVMRGKEYLVAILSENGILRAETLRFQDELRTPGNIGLSEKHVAPKAAVAKFEKAIKAHAAKDIPEDDLHDEEAAKLRKLIQSKHGGKKGETGSKSPEGKGAAVDILEVLKQRLAGGKDDTQGKRKHAEDWESLSRDELYARAKGSKISGRSSMSRRQLINALRKSV
jgi:DNA end-binding protein Ku